MKRFPELVIGWKNGKPVSHGHPLAGQKVSKNTHRNDSRGRRNKTHTSPVER